MAQHDGIEAGARQSRWRWARRALNAGAVAAVVGIVLFFGVRQLREKLAIVKPITFVGPSDDAAYATMGDSLIHGRGLEVRYISFFFIPYSPNITRREDHWPPFMGVAIAPCFYLLGKAAWVTKLPAITFGSIGLPLSAALLAYALSRRGYAAIVAALLMMAHPYMYNQSLRTLSDVATAMLVCGFAASVLLARRWRWMHIIAGLLLAAAYYAKGSEILLLGLYPLMAALACGISVLRHAWFWAGVATAVLLMAPFWYSNQRLFGNPLHSTQNYVSGYYSLEDWEAGTYYPYWGHNPPKTSDRWTKYRDVYWRSSSEQLETLGRTVLTGNEPPPDVWGDFGGWGYRARDFLNGQWARVQGIAPLAHLFGWTGPNDPQHLNVARRKAALEAQWHRPAKPLRDWDYWPWELEAAGAALLVAWLLLVFPAAMGVSLQRWMARRGGAAALQPLTAANDPRDHALIGPVAALVLLFSVQFVFLAYFWAIRTRFSFVFLPILAALGCTAAAHFAERPILAIFAATRAVLRQQMHRPPNPARGTERLLPSWHAALTIGFALTLFLYAKPLEARYADWRDAHMDRSGYPFEDEPQRAALAKWVNAHIPNAVIMTRNPWDLTFSCPAAKGITFPNPDDDGPAGAEQIFAIARYYHVTHLIMDDFRPSLSPYMNGEVPGLKRVRGAPAPVFEIDWSHIPVKTVNDALGKSPAPQGKPI